MSLWGNHAIIKPHGELYVKFHDGDEYVWNTVHASVTLYAFVSLNKDCIAYPA